MNDQHQPLAVTSASGPSVTPERQAWLERQRVLLAEKRARDVDRISR